MMNVESLFSKIRNKKRMSDLTTPIQYSNRSVVKVIKQGKKREIKCIRILFPDDMILHVENTKDATKKTVTTNT